MSSILPDLLNHLILSTWSAHPFTQPAQPFYPFTCICSSIYLHLLIHFICLPDLLIHLPNPLTYLWHSKSFTWSTHPLIWPTHPFIRPPYPSIRPTAHPSDLVIPLPHLLHQFYICPYLYLSTLDLATTVTHPFYIYPSSIYHSDTPILYLS